MSCIIKIFSKGYPFLYSPESKETHIIGKEKIVTEEIMKKTAKILTALALSVCCALPAFGCATEEDNLIKDGKTVNVRVFEAGYGTEWLYALKDKFEAAYAEEGYKINILNPSNSVQTTVVINELYNGGNGVDLYFPGSVWTTQVTAGGEFGKNLVEDLSEIVYSKKAIGFDGKEEEKTVREKMKKGIANDYNVYYEGKEFGFPWADSPSGLAVNKARLDVYGFDMPRTTGEMFDIFDSIMLGKAADGSNVGGPLKTGIYPHTFVSGNSGYPSMMFHTWHAQYTGYERYMEFMTYGTEENAEAYKENGYELYEDKAILEMLNAMYRTFDKNYATLGSTSQTADTANLKMIDPEGGAVFFSNGNWMINEVKAKYPEEAKNLRMINYPVISAVGTKAFGAGTSSNVTDAETCENMLRKAVSLVDENKTDAEIAAALSQEFSVTVSEESAAIVSGARNLYCNRAYGNGAYITKDSPVKDIAALFLRMYASDDNAELFFEKVGTNTVFDNVTERQSEYPFSSDVIKFANKASAISINTMGDCTGLRKRLGHGTTILFGNNYLAPMITAESVTKWHKDGNNYVISGTDEVYYNAALAKYNTNKTFAHDNWTSYIENLK